MENIFITITGVKNYFGMKPFKVGKIFRIVKEDDNDYDEEAIRAFLYLSACANINRYGDFLFGNQNFEEQMITFPEYVSSIIGD